jgi:D-alanyl-D-alanine carboxypeptidase/D-alanyl-D-alanine-endopeptidase (penicillin-binding protein 4)
MQTAVYANGSKSGGVFKGDLFLTGGGDPVLGWEDLRDLAKQVKKAGIKQIKGDIVGDDTLFDDVRLGMGWSWDNEPYYYSAQISALNLRSNVVDVWVKPGIAPGAPAKVGLTPPTIYLGVENLCKTSAAGSQPVIIVDRLRGKNTVRVRGNVPLDYNPASAEESITVEDPALFACQSFIDIIKAEGVSVTGRAIYGKKPKTAARMALHSSPPLSKVLEMLLKPSNNLIAECLLKDLGAQVKKDGSTAAGEQVVLDFMKKIGADMTALAITDGSGLARTDYISPRNLTLLLRYMYWHPNYKVFLEALPIAGVDGTLKKRLAGTAAEKNVRAKTGYVSRVSTVSGYVTTKGGEPLAFSIMMNNHLSSNKEAMAVQDRMLEYLANLVPVKQ